MTLILALESRGGLLLVSDSQATFETAGQQVKLPAQKIFAPWSNVAWGASTNRGGAVQHVRQHLEATFAQRNRFVKKKRYEIRREITAEVAKKVKEIYSQAIQLQGQQPMVNSFIFVSYAQDGPLILEIHPDLTDTDHVDVGYAATGSGDIFPYVALAGLNHFNVRQRTLEEAKLIAHRIVQDAIGVAAQGLGPPVQMIELPLPSADHPTEARKLDDGEIRILEEKVVEWKEVESETLTRFVGLTPGPSPDETVPAPPPGQK